MRVTCTIFMWVSIFMSHAECQPVPKGRTASPTPLKAVDTFISIFASWKNESQPSGSSLEQVLSSVSKPPVKKDYSYLPASVEALFAGTEPSDSMVWFDISSQTHESGREHFVKSVTLTPFETQVTTWYDKPGVDGFNEYQYTLKKFAEGWLIESILCFASDPDEGPLAKWSINSPGFKELADLSLKAQMHFEKIFDPKPGAVLSWDQKHNLSVTEAGKMCFPSGKIAMWVSSEYNFEPNPPFELKVPKSDAQVTFARIDGGIGAIRIAFSDPKNAVAYVPATYLPSSKPDFEEKEVGGIPAIADAEDLSHSNPRSLEKVFKSITGERRGADSGFFDLDPSHPRDCCCFSTIEDNDAEPYWGVDALGKPICLIIHFGEYRLKHPCFDTVIYNGGSSIQTGKMKTDHLLVNISNGSDVQIEPVIDPGFQDRVSFDRFSVLSILGTELESSMNPMTHISIGSRIKLEWSTWEFPLEEP